MATQLVWKDDAGAIEFVVFDAVTSQSHESLMAITEHPVEEGANVVDHARPEAERCTIEGFVSEKPLPNNAETSDFSYQNIDLVIPEKESNFLPTPGALTSAAVNLVESLFNEPQRSARVFKTDGFNSRVRRIYERLDQAREKRRLIRIVTSLREYENMLIERVAVPRTPAESGGALFQIDLKRIRIVRSESVDAPTPAEVRGAVTKAKGSQAGDKDAKGPEKSQSLLAKGADLVGF